MQVHKNTNIAPLELVLAQALRRWALQAKPSLEDFGSTIAYYLKQKSWFKSLTKTTDRSLRHEEARYKQNFDARLREPIFKIPEGYYISLRKEQGTASKPWRKSLQAHTEKNGYAPWAVREN